MRKILLGKGAKERCLEEIQQEVSLSHPDFLYLKPPHTIEATNTWIEMLQESPISAERRYAFLEDAHQMSEVSLSRMLGPLEDPDVKAWIWISSKKMLPDTLHSRFHSFFVEAGGEGDEWENLLSNCRDWLMRSTSSSLWEEWYQISRLYRFYMVGLPEGRCLEEARRLKISGKFSAGKRSPF